MTSDQPPLICDVRALLARGLEPFPHIMEAVGALAPGQALLLLAPFRPSPLIQVLERKGYTAVISKREDGPWEVVFAPTKVAGDSDHGELSDWPDPARFIDCTGHIPAEAEAELRHEFESLRTGEVLFALLPEEPKALSQSWDDKGVRWLGHWDPIAGGYAIMIQHD